MSSLKDDASLILIPSLYKDGRLDTVKPLGNSIVHPDATGNHDGTDGSTLPEANFTFSRGSNLAATRVDVNGLIEKGRENLLLQSNQFDTTWSSINTTETSGQEDKDGGTNAWLLSKSASSARVQQSITQSGVQTYSVYAKAGTLDFVMLNNSLVSQWFDLSNGTIGTNSSSANTIDANIESVGDGWYRCSLTFNSSISIVRIYPSQADNDVSGTSGNIYIQDAQLESSMVATDYIETGASTAQAGILEDMPRLDYSGGASCPALLLEPQRTNLFTQSEYLNGFTTSGSPAPTLTANYAESPEGVDNAYRVEIPSVSGVSFFAQLVSHTSGTNMTVSAYVKSNTATDQSFKLFGDYGTGTGTSGALTATSEWQRFKFTFTPTATGNRNAGIINVANTASDLLVYGLQVEVGSYPTSYIPTYGSSQTRSRDNMDTTFSSALTSNGSVSVLFDFGAAYISDSNSTSNNLEFVFDNGDRIIYNQNAVSQHRIELNVNGGTEGVYKTFGILRSVPAKICVVVTNKTYRIFVNGQLTSSVGSFTGTADWTAAEGFASDINEPIGVTPIKQMLFFPTALTDSECIALTTL